MSEFYETKEDYSSSKKDGEELKAAASLVLKKENNNLTAAIEILDNAFDEIVNGELPLTDWTYTFLQKLGYVFPES